MTFNCILRQLQLSALGSESYHVIVIPHHALWLLPLSLLSLAWQWQPSQAGWLWHMHSVCADGGGLRWIPNLHGTWNRDNEPVLLRNRHLLLWHPVLVHLFRWRPLASQLRNMWEQPRSPSGGEEGPETREAGKVHWSLLGADVPVLAGGPPAEAAARGGNEKTPPDQGRTQLRRVSANRERQTTVCTLCTQSNHPLK